MSTPEIATSPQTPRPISITLIAGLYIAVGALGFIFHFRDSLQSPASGVWVELTEVLAAMAGIYMLRRKDWARWLALAWMGAHVVFSALGALPAAAIHAGFFAAIAWILLRPPAGRYFRNSQGTTGGGAQ